MIIFFPGNNKYIYTERTMVKTLCIYIPVVPVPKYPERTMVPLQII